MHISYGVGASQGVKRVKLCTFLCLVFTLIFAAGLVIYSEKLDALEQCVEDVSGKCGNLYNYAVSLEEENSRLNKLYKECKADNTQ